MLPPLFEYGRKYCSVQDRHCSWPDVVGDAPPEEHRLRTPPNALVLFFSFLLPLGVFFATSALIFQKFSLPLSSGVTCVGTNTTNIIISKVYDNTTRRWNHRLSQLTPPPLCGIQEDRHGLAYTEGEGGVYSTHPVYFSEDAIVVAAPAASTADKVRARFMIFLSLFVALCLKSALPRLTFPVNEQPWAEETQWCINLGEKRFTKTNMRSAAAPTECTPPPFSWPRPLTLL